MKTASDISEPYLTVVVPSRNDNHGGDLLLRMQTFVDSLVELVDRVALPTELLLVDWNPPSDRPKLAAAIRWPASQFCQLRIVEVPGRIHEERFSACGPHLPLHQMIAKNVGIRRARGEFVLATNTDIVLSERLMKWLATRPLQANHFYRADRCDVPLQVMQTPDLDSRLDFCERNVVRVYTRYGVVNGGYFPRGSRIPIRHMLPLWLLHHQDLHYFQLRAADHWRQARRCLGEDVKSPAKWCAAAYYATKSAVRYFRLGLRMLARVCGRPAGQAGRLHLHACGDFTLLAKADWLRLGGYAEFQAYPLHVDSLFLHVADTMGLEQHIVGAPVYHIEHRGSWTPEDCGEILHRLDANNVPYLTYEDLKRLAAQMRHQPKPRLFNDEGWGLAGLQLPETDLSTMRGRILLSDFRDNACGSGQSCNRAA